MAAPRRLVGGVAGGDGHREALGHEAWPEIDPEGGRVPRHHGRRSLLPRDLEDHARHLGRVGRAMEHAADAIELTSEAIESLGPALRHLPPHGLRRLLRSGRASRRRRREEPIRPSRLAADPLQELGACRHREAL